MSIDTSSVGSIVTAVAALGAASFGLVDATKVFGGGVSLAGLGDIEKAILPLFGSNGDKHDTTTPLSCGSVLADLKANWINGVALEAQKAHARILVKLSLNASTAATLAGITGVSPDVLTELAVALNIGAVLTREETDVLNKFEVSLNMILDQAFERADQRYRNCAKLLSGAVSVLIAVIGGGILSSSTLHLGPFQGSAAAYFNTGNFWISVMAGLLATPLAPVFKDLASALHAGSAVAQKIAAK